MGRRLLPGRTQVAHDDHAVAEAHQHPALVRGEGERFDPGLVPPLAKGPARLDLVQFRPVAIVPGQHPPPARRPGDGPHPVAGLPSMQDLSGPHVAQHRRPVRRARQHPSSIRREGRGRQATPAGARMLPGRERRAGLGIAQHALAAGKAHQHPAPIRRDRHGGHRHEVPPRVQHLQSPGVADHDDGGHRDERAPPAREQRDGARRVVVLPAGQGLAGRGVAQPDRPAGAGRQHPPPVRGQGGCGHAAAVPPRAQRGSGADVAGRRDTVPAHRGHPAAARGPADRDHALPMPPYADRSTGPPRGERCGRVAGDPRLVQGLADAGERDGPNPLACRELHREFGGRVAFDDVEQQLVRPLKEPKPPLRRGLPLGRRDESDRLDHQPVGPGVVVRERRQRQQGDGGGEDEPYPRRGGRQRAWSLHVDSPVNHAEHLRSGLRADGARPHMQRLRPDLSEAHAPSRSPPPRGSGRILGTPGSSLASEQSVDKPLPALRGCEGTRWVD